MLWPGEDSLGNNRPFLGCGVSGISSFGVFGVGASVGGRVCAAFG
jgi:hypothetical protein